jgi:hypothetical protein
LDPVLPQKGNSTSGTRDHRGNSLTRKRTPPQDHHRTLGMTLLYTRCRVLRGGVFVSARYPCRTAAGLSSTGLLSRDNLFTRALLF